MYGAVYCIYCSTVYTVCYIYCILYGTKQFAVYSSYVCVNEGIF